jgi:hypothetical protein
MALPHFRNLVSTDTRWEPVYKNLFEVVTRVPEVIAPNGELEPIVLMENATNISLPVTEQIEVVEQLFKYSGRLYVKTPGATTIKAFKITFNINQTDRKTVYVWALLKRWYDLAWNSQTGELHYKHDMLGQITGHIHDRTGEVIRRIDYINCQLIGLTAWDMNWKENGIQDITATFCCDYWTDTYFDVS